MSMKQFTKCLMNVIVTHEENLQSWKESEAEVRKTVNAWINHMKQRDTFSLTQLAETRISHAFPDIKLKIQIKLERKIAEFYEKLHSKVSLMKAQKDCVAKLCEECEISGTNVDLSSTIEWRNTELPSALLIDFLDCLPRLYIQNYHAMSTYLQSQGTIGKFLDIKCFDDIMDQYFLR
eukprot:TRINITY_DN1948_c0_g2_i1.p1 TRINITY_DN1948_c0_g2~~TRINITY_DN1948_c0_g2_i1.p1  ORF type:complete len:178 (+),score=21.65 TRINITY_DN1948_c0_g2_i1:28-561(+)